MEDKKEILFRCAKELFAQKGFKSTNIADITRMAGVSVGTFYNYYPSKEKIFMDIYIEENYKLKKRMMESLNIDDDPIKLTREMFELNISGMKENPILCQWFNRDVFDKIERIFREEKGIEAVDFLYGDFIKIVKKWQEDGKMRKDISPEMIMAIFASIVNIDTHKEEIGLQYFPQVQEYISEFVMDALTDKSKGG